MMELQEAYYELKSSSEAEISDLRVQVANLRPSTSQGKSVVIFYQKKGKVNRSSTNVTELKHSGV